MSAELVLDAVLENVEAATEFVNEHLKQMGCDMKLIFQMDVAIDELFSNICFYAYPEGVGKATLRVEALDEGRTVCVTFEDGGTPFNPLESADPDVTLSLSERQIGGLGIFMVKKSMDDVRYAFEDGQNKLSLYKKI